MHDVDEDARTIVIYGNYWANESQAGITHRDMLYSPTEVFDTVASLKK